MADVDSTKAPEDRFHVVIVGGGIGALEGLLALRALAAERIAMTLVAPNPEFRHRPLSVTEPFDLASPRRLRLADVADEARAIFIEEALAGIDTDRRRIETASSRELDYDAALLAISPGWITPRRGNRDLPRPALKSLKACAHPRVAGIERRAGCRGYRVAGLRASSGRSIPATR